MEDMSRKIQLSRRTLAITLKVQAEILYLAIWPPRFRRTPRLLQSLARLLSVEGEDLRWAVNPASAGFRFSRQLLILGCGV